MAEAGDILSAIFEDFEEFLRLCLKEGVPKMRLDTPFLCSYTRGFSTSGYASYRWFLNHYESCSKNRILNHHFQIYKESGDFSFLESF